MKTQSISSAQGYQYAHCSMKPIAVLKQHLIPNGWVLNHPLLKYILIHHNSPLTFTTSLIKDSLIQVGYQLGTHLSTYPTSQMVVYHDTLCKEVVDSVQITEGAVVVITIVPCATHHRSDRRIRVATLLQLIVGWMANTGDSWLRDMSRVILIASDLARSWLTQVRIPGSPDRCRMRHRKVQESAGRLEQLVSSCHNLSTTLQLIFILSYPNHCDLLQSNHHAFTISLWQSTFPIPITATWPLGSTSTPAYLPDMSGGSLFISCGYWLMILQTFTYSLNI